VAPEEIELAATEILRESIAVPVDELAKPVGYKLGFSQVTTRMETHINAVLEKAGEKGRFVSAMGKIRLP
jgi:hypothetical protein